MFPHLMILLWVFFNSHLHSVPSESLWQPFLLSLTLAYLFCLATGVSSVLQLVYEYTCISLWMRCTQGQDVHCALSIVICLSLLKYPKDDSAPVTDRQKFNTGSALCCVGGICGFSIACDPRRSCVPVSPLWVQLPFFPPVCLRKRTAFTLTDLLPPQAFQERGYSGNRADSFLSISRPSIHFWGSTSFKRSMVMRQPPGLLAYPNKMMKSLNCKGTQSK